MMFTLNAYEYFDAWQVSLQRAHATGAGYQWTNMLTELWRPPVTIDSEPWDIAWGLGQLLSERALERGKS